MTNPNNAAQPVLTDDEIEALAKRHIAPHADRLDAILPNRVPYQQTEQFRRVKALLGDALSKLRTAQPIGYCAVWAVPGSQFVIHRSRITDERQAMFTAKHWVSLDSHANMSVQAVYAAPVASAPVAGEAQPVAWMRVDGGDCWTASNKRALSAGGIPERLLAEQYDTPLYAAPQASAMDFAEPYEGAREDLAIWKRRALEAERDLRTERETSSRLVAMLNAENGPTYMGEPAPQASEAVRNAALEEAAVIVETAPDYLQDSSFNGAARAIRALKQPQADKDGGHQRAGDVELLDLMERAALEAGASQWIAEGFESRAPGAAFHGGLIMAGDGETVVAQCVNEKNASHMMSSSPANVLWLTRQCRAALSATQTEQGERDE